MKIMPHTVLSIFSVFLFAQLIDPIQAAPEILQQSEHLSAIQESWQKEYDQLRSRISSRSGLMKRGDVRRDLLDPNAAISETDRDPADVVLRRTEALLKHLWTLPRCPNLSGYRERLLTLQKRSSSVGLGKESVSARTSLYLDACALRRQIAFSNPLLDFDTLLFYRWGGQSGYFQTHNYPNSSNGGEPELLCNYKSASPTVKKILTTAVFANGPYSGKKILQAGAKNGPGKFHTIDLSYDAKSIVFAWTAQGGYTWTDTTTYNIMKAKIDGSEVVQLTSGDIFNDYSPIWTPNDRIVFISERGGGISRCMSLWQFHPSGTMFSMKTDGTDMIPISYHETAETHPAMTNDGGLVYSRWDYIDRDWNFHSIWTCGLDGTDPRSPHGNYPFPYYVPDTPGLPDGRVDRPTAEHSFLPIPGSNSKFVCIATSHHQPPLGVPIVIDIAVSDDNAMSQVKKITDQCIPDELCEYPGDDGAGPSKCDVTKLERFAEPYPLSEDFYLVGTGDGLYTLDKFGNKELLIKGNWCRYPIPLKPRVKPPVRTTKTYQGERASDMAPKATISFVNVYQSDFTWPTDAKIKELRIIQLVPFPWRTQVNENGAGFSNGGIVRMVLGRVPVESDGSAYFEAPVEREIYFQALDSLGTAVQSMRSGTYVHPGEQMSCVGCHEDKWKSAYAPPQIPSAFKRAPSVLRAEPPGPGPMSFYRVMKPLITGTCNPCHQKEKKALLGQDYNSLSGTFYFHASGPCNIGVPSHGGSRTLAGRFGFRESKIGKTLIATHQNRLTKDQFRQVASWIDANSMQYGAYYDHDAEKAGEVIWPVRREGIEWPFIQVDSKNPSGVERLRTNVVPIAQVLRGYGLLGMKTGNLAVERRGRILRVWNGSNMPVRVVVYSLDGRVVAATLSKASFDHTELDLHAVRNGTYIVNVSAGMESISKKLALSMKHGL